MPKPSEHTPREAEVAANPDGFVCTVFLGHGKYEKRPADTLAEAWVLADQMERELGRGAMVYAVKGEQMALMVRPR